MFVDDFEPVGKQVWNDLLRQGLVKIENRKIYLTDVGKKELNDEKIGEIEEIKDRLKTYRDISTHPVLNDVYTLLSYISTLQEKVKEADLRHQEDNNVIKYWTLRSDKSESRIKEL